MASNPHDVIETVQRFAQPLPGEARDYDPILKAIGQRRFVLIGEASHGTHEFYAIRAQITQRLIEEQGFTAVIVEADWPDAYRVNRYVHGTTDDSNADDALGGFKRFPTWMWRNRDVVEFVEWLRARNTFLKRGRKAGFYGMDLYSLYTSIDEVLTYLDRVDPAAAKRARHRYACFERFEDDPQQYGYASSFDLSASCEDAAVAQLLDMVRSATKYQKIDGISAEDEHFYAEQNARLVSNAEEYYRTMFQGRVSSWNLRDQHMVETIDALMQHLDRSGEPHKAVIWAHNSHLGDARATDMGKQGEWNVGQLMREKYPNETFNIGFTTHTGFVTAASDWGGLVERKPVMPSLHGSYERVFHEVGIERFLLMLDRPDVIKSLGHPMLERAIGVIYLPETERYGHYFTASLANQFDAVMHVDHTKALEPLETSALWHHEEAETYPTGF